MKTTRELLFVSLALVLAGCSGPPVIPEGRVNSECVTPSALADGWQVGAPESVAIDGSTVCRAVERIRSGALANVHSILVARRGRLVIEKYFPGRDEARGRSLGVVDFGPQTKHDLRSASKSVVSLLFGIALAEGKIRSVNDPALDYFPEYPDLRTPERTRIRLSHLLAMTMGVEWDETGSYLSPFNSETRMDWASDRARFVLSRPIVAAPGERFTYNGGATALLARVVQRATGRKLDAYARDVLFGPLGIDDYEWLAYPNGEPIAASGLRLRPRDLAKIAQLYLSDGQWNGRQVAPTEWIRESIRPKSDVGGGVQYGYQWWLDRSIVGGKTIAWAAARGNGGQRAFVIPALDLVVVVMAGNYNDASRREVPVAILNDHVLAAVRDAR